MTLKYHYSNPKFKGLPWPADKQEKKSKKKKNTCVKKPYEDKAEVQAEVEELRREFPTTKWWIYFCENRDCRGWHIGRKRGRSRC